MKPLSLLILNFLFLIIFFLYSGNLLSQTLWGMAYDGGSKLTGGNIFSLKTDGSGFQEQFAFKGDEAIIGQEGMLDGGDGFLYGMTYNNVSRSAGVFRMHPDGGAYQIIHEFEVRKGIDVLDGSGLVKSPDGFLYGGVCMGGAYYYGVIYKLKLDGSQYQVIHNFNGITGSSPEGEIALTPDGYLVGAMRFDSTGAEGGTIYKIKTDGTDFKAIHVFVPAEGTDPVFGVRAISALGSTKIYGINRYHGPHNNGSLYRLNVDGTGFQAMHTDMTGSFQGLTNDANNIYFTETDGGTGGKGSVWKQNLTFGTTVRIADLGSELTAGSGKIMGDAHRLFLDNGILYSRSDGFTGYPNGCIFKLSSDGSNPGILWKITNQDALLHCSNGRVFIAFNTPTPQDKNTIYSIAVNGGDYKTVHVFESPDGCYPTGGLISNGQGSLLGLASYGGTQQFFGVVFQFEAASGEYSLISNFSDPFNGSGNPLGSITKASDGSYYFTKQLDNIGDERGAIGKITQGTFSSGVNYTSYQQFSAFDKSPSNVLGPEGTMTEGTDGYLYGTAVSTQSGHLGCIYKVGKTGSPMTVLHLFTGAADGSAPTSALTKGPDGFLYGMTENGGLQDYGTIFRISNSGSKTTLFQFGSGTGMYSANGVHPKGPLLFGKDGKIYGMTSLGGTYWQGVVFRINVNGSGYQVLYHFNGINGAQPQGRLIQDTTQTLYGMTMLGGTSNMGTIFKIGSNGVGFQKLLDFNGGNGKYPKGELLLYSTVAPTMSATKVASRETAVSAYPNPFNSVLTFSIRLKNPGKLTYTLMDVNGRPLRQGSEIATTIDYEKTLTVPELAAGSYFLELVTEDGRYAQTLIKQ